MTLSDAPTSQRASYYIGKSIDGNQPKSVLPSQHTMKEIAFLKYIGVPETVQDVKIEGKKFSPRQAAALEEAYKQGRTVRIFGAPREDMEFIASLHGREIISESVCKHDREAKNSNTRRAVMFLARKRAADNVNTELWVFVFPSKQYVDQVAELIQAIFDRLYRVSPTGRPLGVRVIHFPELEASVANWTGFIDEAKKFVRFGEVVVIGNLDILLPGIRAAGFSHLDGWLSFGLSDMFRVLRCVDLSAKKQILLVGMVECFWGEASALYSEALIQCGARHILYGSKAGNLAKRQNIGKVMAPNYFCAINPDMFIDRTPGFGMELEAMMRACSIIDSGAVVTVNTVIGEDESERMRYDDQRPAIIDCEDWHIAQVVDAYNKAVSLEIEQFQREVAFIPVHFITDYIHSETERAHKKTRHLGSDPNDPKYRAVQAKQFGRIGLFFGLYAHRFGLRDNMDIQLSSIDVSSKNLSKEVTGSHTGTAHIDFGLGRLRVEYLQQNWRRRLLPLEDVAVLCRLSQFAGYSRLFFRAYQMIEARKREIDPRELIFFDVLHLKVLLQRGAWVSADEKVKSIEDRADWSELLQLHRQLGAYARRKLLISANAQKPASAGFKLDELTEGVPHRVRYESIANKLFGHIASLYGMMDANRLRDLSGELTELRTNLYQDTASAQDNEVRYEKSALALLYLEAAAYLKWGAHEFRERIYKILYVAYILNVRIGGNEASELNGEILNACSEPGQISLLSLAMRRDDEAVIRMRELIFRRYPEWALDVGLSATRSLSVAPKERGQIITEILGYR